MDKMNQAIAILKAGRSFQEASEITGIPAAQIMAEWNDNFLTSEVR